MCRFWHMKENNFKNWSFFSDEIKLLNNRKWYKEITLIMN